MAAPPSSPGYQASRIAFACSFAQLTLSALPFISTTTSGFPAEATLSSESYYGNNHIRFFSRCEGFGAWLRIELGPDQLAFRFCPIRRPVLDLQRVRLACREVHVAKLGLHSVGVIRHRHHLAIEPNAEEAVSSKAKVVIIGCVRRERRFPADQERVGLRDLGR